MHRIIRTPNRLMINSDGANTNQSTQISLHVETNMPQQKNAEGHALIQTMVLKEVRFDECSLTLNCL